jgi:hypothetical protein
VEGVHSGFFFPYYASNITVLALSSNGSVTASLPVSNVLGGCRFHIDPKYKTVWYDVRINSHLRVTNSTPLPNPNPVETNSTSSAFPSKFRIFPNPFDPDKDGLFCIEYNRTDPVKLRDRDKVGFDIYTTTGEMVVSLKDERKQGVFFWDGKNAKGRRVAKGIYFCVMTINGKPLEKRVYKIGIR